MSADLFNFVGEYKDKDQAPIVQGLFGNASRENNTLYKKCLPVTEFQLPYLKDTLDIMYKTMIEEHGIGIAANQVGLNLQIFIIESRYEDSDIRYKNLLNVKKQIFINPKIKSASKQLTNFWHACLSAKGQLRGQVATYKSISYEALDEDLNKISGKLDGMAAVIFQHEFRHLLGNLYVDYAHKLLDAEDLNNDLKNGNYDDLDDCDSSIPHLLSDYKVGTAI
jgi:peptide deformylase